MISTACNHVYEDIQFVCLSSSASSLSLHSNLHHDAILLVILAGSEVCLYNYCHCVKMYQGTCQERTTLRVGCSSDSVCESLFPSTVCDSDTGTCRCPDDHLLVNTQCLNEYHMQCKSVSGMVGIFIDFAKYM